jgi:hypothetical protein
MTVRARSCRSGGIRTKNGRPMISSAVYWNRRSAPSFHDTIVPSDFQLQMASREALTMATRWRYSASPGSTLHILRGGASPPRRFSGAGAGVGRLRL